MFALAAGALAQEKPAATPKVDSAKLAQIEEFLNLTKADQLSQQMLTQFENVFNEEIKKSLPAIPKAADHQPVKEDVEKFQKQLFGIIRDQLSYERMKPGLVRLYDESFTTDELVGINAFYKSPAGQAYLAKIPLLTQKAMQVGSNLMVEAMPQIQKMTVDWTEEMKKKYGGPGAK